MLYDPEAICSVLRRILGPVKKAHAKDPAFGAEVPTDGRVPAEIAGRIMEGIGTPNG